MAAIPRRAFWPKQCIKSMYGRLTQTNMSNLILRPTVHTHIRKCQIRQNIARSRMLYKKNELSGAF